MPMAAALQKNDMQSITAKTNTANHLIRAAETMAAKTAVFFTADARRIEKANQGKTPYQDKNTNPNKEHDTPPRRQSR